MVCVQESYLCGNALASSFPRNGLHVTVLSGHMTWRTERTERLSHRSRSLCRDSNRRHPWSQFAWPMMRSEVTTSVNIRDTIFCDVTSCSLVDGTNVLGNLLYRSSIPQSYKCQLSKFRSFTQSIYTILTACDIYWNFIWTIYSRNIWGFVLILFLSCCTV
jgi:hypothetical protein